MFPILDSKVFFWHIVLFIFSSFQCLYVAKFKRFDKRYMNVSGHMFG